MGQVKAPDIPPPLGRETSEKAEGTVRELVIEVDGVRHKQVADDPNASISDYCTPKRCSLYEMCQKYDSGLCYINDSGAEMRLHYEKESDEAPESKPETGKAPEVKP